MTRRARKHKSKLGSKRENGCTPVTKAEIIRRYRRNRGELFSSRLWHSYSIPAHGKVRAARRRREARRAEKNFLRKNRNSMRIILYLGKGGVGKTTIAAATAVRSATLGQR